MKLLFNNNEEFWSDKELKELVKTSKIRKILNKIFKR
jgi:hypothetical protein